MIPADAIRVSDRTHINHTNVLIYTVLSDLSTYSAWWPGAKITKVDDETIEVSPFGPGSFLWKITQSEENRQVVLSYDGIFSGTGTWSIEKDGAMSWLTYSVSLTIEHGFFKFINKFISINKLHAKMMKKVFIKLDQYLNNYHAEK